MPARIPRLRELGLGGHTLSRGLAAHAPVTVPEEDAGDALGSLLLPADTRCSGRSRPVAPTHPRAMERTKLTGTRRCSSACFLWD